MKTKLLHDNDDQRTFVVVMDPGDEVIGAISTFSARERISAASITGIGALSSAVIRYFDWPIKEYLDIPVGEQVEIASLVGDIGESENGKEPAIHMHVVLGRRDGSALAGHLKEGHVRPTLELLVTESPSHLCRRRDEATGLMLIEL